MTTFAEADLVDLARIDDPHFYVSDPYPVYARLRREAPVFYCEALDTWVLTKYEDIRAVSANPTGYSVAQGFFLSDIPAFRDAMMAQVADTDLEVLTGGFDQSQGEMVATTDPPRHTELRGVLAPAFTPRAVAAQEPIIRRIVAELLDQFEADTEFDWIEDVAGPLPTRVIAAFLGIPDSDHRQFSAWSDEITKIGQLMTHEELTVSQQQILDLREYLLQQFERKRTHPGDDLMTMLLSAELDNDKLSPDDMLTWATIVLLGGSETTRALLGNMMWELAQHPDARVQVVADPSLSARVVEEAMRFSGPVHGFVRAVQADTELRGRQLRKGQFVYMVYEAGNRDEEKFEDPERYDLRRTSNTPQLGFGIGIHHCIGAGLARLESRILIEELVGRHRSWAIGNEATRVESIFRNGFHRLPVTFAGT